MFVPRGSFIVLNVVLTTQCRHVSKKQADFIRLLRRYNIILQGILSSYHEVKTTDTYQCRPCPNF